MINDTQQDEGERDKTLIPYLQEGETALTVEYVAAHANAPTQPPSGGDFHIAFPLQDGSNDVAVVIGDVAGHGPEQTGQAEHMQELLSDCLSLGLSPAHTLETVNALVEPDPHFEGFGTVFVGKLEGQTGNLTYASGGHEPALLAVPDEAASGHVEELIGTGPPVGAFPPELAHFEQRDAFLPPEGTLLLYTDGVSDAHPPQSRKEWFGIERLKEMLAQLVKLSPRRLVSELLGRVATFCRGRFDDDVAILAIRRREPRSRKSAPK